MTQEYTISYDPLWKLLIDKKMSKTELTKAAGLSKATVAKMGKNESVTLEVIGRVCAELRCPISDVVEILITPATQANNPATQGGKAGKADG